MASARDLMVIDEKGDEHIEIDLADIDSALAGVRSLAPAGWTANECYEIYRQWINGKSPYEIERDRKALGIKAGIKAIVGAIQFIRYKVGLTIDPQVEQHKIVALTKLIIGGLIEQLHQTSEKVKLVNKLMKGFEITVPDSEDDLVEIFKNLDATDIGKYSSLLDLRQRLVKEMTSITSQIAVYNDKHANLTGATIAAKKTANKQKGKTLEDKLDLYDDATLQKMISDLSTDVQTDFAPQEQ